MDERTRKQLDRIIELLESIVVGQEANEKRKRVCMACQGTGLYKGLTNLGAGHCQNCYGTGYDQ